MAKEHATEFEKIINAGRYITLIWKSNILGFLCSRYRLFTISTASNGIVANAQLDQVGSARRTKLLPHEFSSEIANAEIVHQAEAR